MPKISIWAQFAIIVTTLGCAHETNYFDYSWSEQEVGAHHSIGGMENGSNISWRPTTSTSIIANAGLKLQSYVPFIALQYHFIGQNIDPINVNYQNISGDGYLISVGLKYKFEPIAFSAGYNFFGSYKLSKKTTTHLESVYENPAGYFAKIDFSLNYDLTLFLILTKTEYQRHTLDGREYNQGNLTYVSYGLGVSYKL